MLAVVGKCTMCKKKLNIIEPGLVCFDCEKYYHGSCLIPPLNPTTLKNIVLTNEGWYCPKCRQKSRTATITRTDNEMNLVRQKFDTIMEVRDHLIGVEFTLNNMLNKCHDLIEDAIYARHVNEKLRKRLFLHETNTKIVPTTFEQWLEERKLRAITDIEHPETQVPHAPPLERTLSQSINESLIRVNSQKALADKRRSLAEKHPKKKAPKLSARNLKNPHEFSLFVSDLKSFAATKSLNNKEKIIYWINTNLTKGWFLHVLLVLALIIYTLIGALIFMTVEGGYENKLVLEIEEERNRLLKTGIGTKELEEYYDFLEVYFNKSGNLMTRGDERNWNFVGSVFFCGITYTSLGYGGMFPITVLGKILVIFYALFGIPLFLIILAALGSLLARIIKQAIGKCRKCTKPKNKKRSKDLESAESSNNDEIEDVPLTVFFVLELFYFLIGTIIYMFGEKWNFFESFYFICITMLTLGIGEYVPRNRAFMICCIAYVIIGLALTSMGISIIMDKMDKKFNAASHKLGAAFERYVEETYKLSQRQSRDRLSRDRPSKDRLSSGRRTKMLAVKGKCTLCKKVLSILEPGIVCFQCEKYHHGSCLTPPHDMKMITRCVLSKTGWLCPRCSGNIMAKISWKTRTDEDVIEVKGKIDIIVEVREILILIEAALKSMSAKCKELNDEAISYSDQNKIMKQKIKLHEKYKKPKNFQEWHKGRKKIGVGQEIRRKPVRKTRDAKEAELRRNELEKHIKKEHLMKPSKKEKIKKSETIRKKKRGKLVYYTDKMLSKDWLVQILLFLTMIAYTFIGALIYRVIEGRYEEELVNEILTERQRVLNNFSNQSLSEYYDFLAEKYESNSKLLARGEEELNWSFVGCLFFCGTTYTTIGYGDITPVTNAGKIFTIIYAMIGIPLFLILLASLGKTVLKLLEFDCNIFKLCKKTETEEEYFEMDKTEDKPSNVPLWHMMIYLFIVILIGVIVFYVGEGWFIEDSIYFIFITLYTIGFGDIYPTNRSYMLICVLYIIIGLVFASMTISLVAETLKRKVNMASNKLSDKIDKYAEEKRY